MTFEGFTNDRTLTETHYGAYGYSQFIHLYNDGGMVGTAIYDNIDCIGYMHRFRFGRSVLNKY